MLATREQLQTFEKDLGEHLLAQQAGILGPRPGLGDSLDRLIRWVPAGVEGSCEDAEHLEYEADTRNVELLRSSLGFTGATKGLTSPGIQKPTKADDIPLADDPRAVYRSCVMRLAYLVLERPDLQFAGKELARCTSAPVVWDTQQLRRCMRYLALRPRVVQSFRVQSVGGLVVFSVSDSDDVCGVPANLQEYVCTSSAVVSGAAIHCG